MRRRRFPKPILAPANLNQSSFGLVVSRKIKLICRSDCPIVDCHGNFLFVKFTICHAVAIPKNSVSWTNGHFVRLCSAVPQKGNRKFYRLRTVQFWPTWGIFPGFMSTPSKLKPYFFIRGSQLFGKMAFAQF